MKPIVVFLFATLSVAAEPAKDDAAKKELALFEGEWTAVSIEREGQPLPEMYVKGSTRVFKGDELTVMVGGELFMKAKCAVDPSKTPKSIDYVVSAGPFKGKTLLGIYELKGDTLKTCFASPDKERPSEFKTKASDGQILSSWKKEKK
jgi:uncharacterized protein (TIGR03067 family)